MTTPTPTDELRKLLKRCDYDSTVGGLLDEVVTRIEQERTRHAALLEECREVLQWIDRTNNFIPDSMRDKARQLRQRLTTPTNPPPGQERGETP